MSELNFKSELGLLGLLGYQVGNHGLRSSERKKILNRVWALPISDRVKREVANWQEWGEPMSPTRREKLITTLSTFINRQGMAQAVSDWQRDLDYVANTLCKTETPK